MNAKIERVNREIEKTKGKIATQQARLRDLEQQKTNLENEEIVALFRREKLTETEFAALLRGQRNADSSISTPEVQEKPNMEGSGGNEEI